MQNELRGLVISNCDSKVADCSGEAQLHVLGFDNEFSVTQNAGILLGIVLVTIIISYFALWRTTSKGKR